MTAAGFRSINAKNPGLNLYRMKTSAVSAATYLIKPGMARNPNRRSSLSDHDIGRHGKGSGARFKTDRQHAIGANRDFDTQISAPSGGPSPSALARDDK